MCHWIERPQRVECRLHRRRKRSLLNCAASMSEICMTPAIEVKAPQGGVFSALKVLRQSRPDTARARVLFPRAESGSGRNGGKGVHLRRGSPPARRPRPPRFPRPIAQWRSSDRVFGPMSGPHRSQPSLECGFFHGRPLLRKAYTRSGTGQYF